MATEHERINGVRHLHFELAKIEAFVALVRRGIKDEADSTLKRNLEMQLKGLEKEAAEGESRKAEAD